MLLHQDAACAALRYETHSFQWLAPREDVLKAQADLARPETKQQARRTHLFGLASRMRECESLCSSRASRALRYTLLL